MVIFCFYNAYCVNPIGAARGRRCGLAAGARAEVQHRNRSGVARGGINVRRRTLTAAVSKGPQCPLGLAGEAICEAHFFFVSRLTTNGGYCLEPNNAWNIEYNWLTIPASCCSCWWWRYFFHFWFLLILYRSYRE